LIAANGFSSGRRKLLGVTVRGWRGLSWCDAVVSDNDVVWLAVWKLLGVTVRGWRGLSWCDAVVSDNGVVWLAVWMLVLIVICETCVWWFSIVWSFAVVVVRHLGGIDFFQWTKEKHSIIICKMLTFEITLQSV
jgi:hypothetical protein